MGEPLDLEIHGSIRKARPEKFGRAFCRPTGKAAHEMQPGTTSQVQRITAAQFCQGLFGTLYKTSCRDKIGAQGDRAPPQRKPAAASAAGAAREHLRPGAGAHKPARKGGQAPGRGGAGPEAPKGAAQGGPGGPPKRSTRGQSERERRSNAQPGEEAADRAANGGG